MKEIICLNIGQAGIRIGNSFWELLALEHNISLDGTRLNTEIKDNPLSFFTCTKGEKYVPRSLTIDLDADTVMEVQTGAFRHLYRPDSFISGKSGGCVYSCGYNGKESQKIKQESLDKFHSIAETCDNLEGIIVFHSVAGGTGSGLADSIFNKVSQTHPRIPKVSYTLYPSARMSSSPIEAYNAVLSQYSLVDNIDLSIMFDNAAIYNILSDKLKVVNPSYNNINQLIAQVASSTTASMRFEASGINNLKEMIHNINLYPRVHFVLPSYSPLTNTPRLFHEQPSVFSITDGLFDPSNTMVSADYTQGSIFVSCVMYRGDVVQYDVNLAIEDVKAKRGLKFLKLTGQGIKSWTINASPVTIPDSNIAEMTRTGTALINSSCLSQYWKSLQSKAESLYSRRAFLHWFTKEWSVTEMDDHFNSAKDCLKEVANDYIEFSQQEPEREEEDNS